MKSITPSDIAKGIAFSIGLVVAYYVIFFVFGYVSRALFADVSPLAIIIGLSVLIAVWGILSGFSVAVRFGFSVNDLFKMGSEKKKEE